MVCRKGPDLARAFYPFVEGEEVPSSEPREAGHTVDVVRYPARIAVYDDLAAAPRVVIVEPSDPRSYLEEITATVNRLSREQGGTIPFMVIREIVENFIHAYFISPTITILDLGNTLRFSDQGPGIHEKARALEYGTSSATEEMKHYIRGVGSGLPYVRQYMTDKGGSLDIQDNISQGTVVTISTRPQQEAQGITHPNPARQPDGGQATAPQGTHAVQQGSVPPRQSPAMSERGTLVMHYLADHECCGPTDLTRAYGYSGPTWSRELSTLVSLGLVRKIGQKYHPAP